MQKNDAPKRGRDTFKKIKWLLSFFVSFYRLFPVKTRKKLLERHRYTRGKLGIGLRYALLKSLAAYCGDNVSVFEGVYLLNPQNLRVGNNVSIQPMCYIECGKDPALPLIIEDDVSIAHGATLMATTHTYSDLNLPIKDQPVETKALHIHENVWIGAKASILAGVTLASGCIIGAGAVVTKDTKENTIYGGVPARVIKER